MDCSGRFLLTPGLMSLVIPLELIFRVNFFTDLLMIFFVLYAGFFLSYLPTPPLGQDMTQRQFLSGV